MYDILAYREGTMKARSDFMSAARLALVLFALLGACQDAEKRKIGQSDFISAAPGGAAPAAAGGGKDPAAPTDGSGTQSPGPDAINASEGQAPERVVEETDIYRIEGDRLYYLNGFRGLMVFDISNIDAPRFLGRSPIYGKPIEMIVRASVAHVVLSDWLDRSALGAPFRGSVVRAIDTSDPAAMRVVGEARIGGRVRDTRVVGDVLYAMSEDIGWAYDWRVEDPKRAAPLQATIASVKLGSDSVTEHTVEDFAGYAGAFFVSASNIVFARTVLEQDQAKTELVYIDISDPNGAIARRGSIRVSGSITEFGTDNSRFNLDFSDGRHARLVTKNPNASGVFTLHVVDFVDPNLPIAVGTLPITVEAVNVSARFDAARLYLAPADSYGATTGETPLRIYDTSTPSVPVLAGQAAVSGDVWLLAPNGDRLFALGGQLDTTAFGSSVVLHYLDVSSGVPAVLGSSTFGQGWAWSPAAETFKAFTLDNAQGLAVLPFSTWSESAGAYTCGLQILAFDAASITQSGTINTHGWVTRGVFAKGRLLALSDTALSVVDYSNLAQPVVTSELTLARNVVATVPLDHGVAQLSSDWRENDVTQSELRIVGLDDPEGRVSDSALQALAVDGVFPQLFRHDGFVYIVTGVKKSPTSWTHKVSVLELGATSLEPRGSVELPEFATQGFSLGFGSYLPQDWFSATAIVQVGGDALAIDRGRGKVFIVDLSAPDAPQVAPLPLSSSLGWSGGMFASGGTLFLSSYEWLEPRANRWYVRYHLNRIDLRDRAHPTIAAQLSVPGIVVGVSEADDTVAYSMDYQWSDAGVKNAFMVLRLTAERAELVATLDIAGKASRIFTSGTRAFLSAERDAATIELHAIDVSAPDAPVDSVVMGQQGWGWMLGAAGDRLLVKSGWGGQALDIYRLGDDGVPLFEQSVRTRGVWGGSQSRQGDVLYISTGYWGVQAVSLAGQNP